MKKYFRLNSVLSSVTTPVAILWLIWVLALFFTFINIDFFTVAKSDFVSYFVGAKMVKEGFGRELFVPEANYSFQSSEIDPSVGKNILIFRSLPFVALLFMPLTFFSITSAFKLFSLLNLAVLCFLSFLLYKTFLAENKLRGLVHTFSLLVPYIFLPTIENLEMGQTAFLITLVFLFVYISLRTKRSFLVGLFSSLLLAKFQYSIAFPFFLVLSKDKKKCVTGFLLGAFFLLSISALISGITSIVEYPSFIVKTESPFFGSRTGDMFTFSALTSFGLSFFGVSRALAFFTNLILYLFGFYLFIKIFKNFDLDRSFAIAVLFTVVFAVHVLFYDLALTLIPIYVLLGIYSREREGLALFSSILLYSVPIMIFGPVPFVASLIYILVIFYLFKKDELPKVSWKLLKTH